MENASKALLMAAGVLVGILILTLAVYLFLSFGSSSARIHKEIEENQINQFNANFTQYENNDETTIYNVISVARLAKNYNEKNDFKDNNEKIMVKFEGKNLHELSEEELTKIMTEEQKSTGTNELKKYNCKITTNKNTKLVHEVIFTEKN